jgi:hypothetical protein
MATGNNTSMPDLGEGAILIWLKEGLEPRKGQFGAKPDGVDPRPVSWSRFDLALSFAMHDPRTDERLPWIKTGGRVIRPTELRAMFGAAEGLLG